MAGFAVAQIEILAIGLLKPLHELRQRLGGTLNQKMDMVGHETISVEGMTELPSVAAQPFKIRLVIDTTEKSLSTLGYPGQ
jgi:hypothetical protein